MSIKLHPQSYEEAFQFGELLVSFFFQAEFCWLHATDRYASLPEIVDTKCGQLRDLVRELQRVVPPRSRARLCDGLLKKLDIAWQEYRTSWGMTEHRRAIAAMKVAEPEWEFDIEQDLLPTTPVVSDAWRQLRRQIVDFIEDLPPVLRGLAKLGELVNKASHWSATDPDESKRSEASLQCFVTVIIDRQIKKALRRLARGFVPVRGIECDLDGKEYDDAILILAEFRSQMMTAIQQHAINQVDRAKAPPKASTGMGEGNRPLKHCAELAWQSYLCAIKHTCPSQSSSSGTDKAIWDWLRENGLDGYQLPRFENWARYLRKARQFYKPPRDPLLADRTGRSIAGLKDVYTKRGERHCNRSRARQQ